MRDYILMFSLSFVLLAWINLHSRRTKEKKRMQKEAKEILPERLKSRSKSVVIEGWKAAVMKKIGDLPLALATMLLLGSGLIGLAEVERKYFL